MNADAEPHIFDDPSEPPPTEYPGTGVTAWRYPQPVQQGMMVVTDPVRPPGVWDCTPVPTFEVPMLMMSSGAGAQATGTGMMWQPEPLTLAAFQEQTAWEPEPWTQVHEPMPKANSPAPTPSVDEPPPKRRMSPSPQVDKPTPERGSSPSPQVDDRAKRGPRSRSNPRSGMTGIAGEARQRAEQANKDAHFPQLPLKSSQTSKVQSEWQAQTLLDSVWIDPVPAGASSDKPATKQPPKARAAGAGAAVPPRPRVADATVAPRKVATRETEVQCELLNASTNVAVAQPPPCKQCGKPSAGDVLGMQRAKFPAESAEKTAWGPASDWAWDHDQNIDDTDDWHEHDASGTVEEVRVRQLPPAPSAPPPVPPQKQLPLCTNAGNGKADAETPGGNSSSDTSCPADSEASPSEHATSPRASSSSGNEDDRPCAEAKDFSKAGSSDKSVSQAHPTLVKSKMPAATKENPAKAKPSQEAKQCRAKETTPSSAMPREGQPTPVTHAHTVTASAKSKRNHQASHKDVKKAAVKRPSCRFFNLKLKSIVAGLVATLGLLIAQGGVELRMLGLESEEVGPVSQEVGFAEMERAKATAKQVKNDVVAARQRVMDKEWKPLQARFDEAYQAARKKRNSDGWWNHQHAQVLQEQQTRLKNM